MGDSSTTTYPSAVLAALGSAAILLRSSRSRPSSRSTALDGIYVGESQEVVLVDGKNPVVA